MQKTDNFQDKNLSQLMAARAPVTVFLMNGYQMHGVVTGYDSFVVLLESEGRRQMVSKHAISTIASLRPAQPSL